MAERFSFNFQLDGEAATPMAVAVAPKSKPAERNREFVFLEGVQEMVNEKKVDELNSDVILTLADGSSLRKVIPHIQSDKGMFNELEKQGTDIIPGTYEGGLKVWECSLDLCRYIVKHRDTLKPTFAMELGCGHGLPLCLILRNGLQNSSRTKVLFADFNDFVLKDVTMANIMLNTEGYSSEKVAESVVLGAGDWLAMSDQLLAKTQTATTGTLPKNGRFDLILAAETTYTAEAAEETAVLLSKHLALGGIGLVATKRYYFGCGGGSDALRSAAAACPVSIEGRSYSLSIQSVEVFDDGSGNIRELLKVILEPSCSGA
jgi:predicted nicotinamide N-methyase